MPYTLKQAAEATGKTKPTILRAIQTSKISAKKNDLGAWEIDPAELHRVYPPLSDGVAQNGTELLRDSPAKAGELRVENDLLRQMLTDRDQVIDDLRQRLDAETEERRKLTAMLTDQRPRRSWWSWGKR